MGGSHCSHQVVKDQVKWCCMCVVLCRVTVGTRDSRCTDSLRPDFTDVVTVVTSDMIDGPVLLNSGMQ